MSESLTNANDGFHVAAASDVGMRRSNNQDSFVYLPASDEVTWGRRGHLLVVADGMGAHAAGELASKLAVEAVAHHYRKHLQLSAPEAILRALKEANQEIHQRGQANAEFHNMGTTCSALLLLPQGALVAHVGDSRVYRVRGRHIEQLTFDHSLAWEMQATGTPGATQTHLNIPRNVITRSLGPQAAVQVDLEGPLEIQQGDTFLCCSDGLTGRVEDQELGLIVGSLPPDESAQLLVDLANLRGGPDNITVIIARAVTAEGATQAWRGDPLVVGQELKPSSGANPLFWVAAVVALVIAGGSAVLGFLPGAAVALVGAAASALMGWYHSGEQGDEGIPLTSGRRLGRAPYVRVECPGNSQELLQLHDSLRESMQELTMGGRQSWPDADRARACLDEARMKAESSDAGETLTLLAVAARLMAQFVAQHHASS